MVISRRYFSDLSWTYIDESFQYETLKGWITLMNGMFAEWESLVMMSLRVFYDNTSVNCLWIQSCEHLTIGLCLQASHFKTKLKSCCSWHTKCGCPTGVITFLRACFVSPKNTLKLMHRFWRSDVAQYHLILTCWFLVIADFFPQLWRYSMSFTKIFWHRSLFP
jgi:hypothetical protein